MGLILFPGEKATAQDFTPQITFPSSIPGNSAPSLIGENNAVAISKSGIDNIIAKLTDASAEVDYLTCIYLLAGAAGFDTDYAFPDGEDGIDITLDYDTAASVLTFKECIPNNGTSTTAQLRITDDTADEPNKTIALQRIKMLNTSHLFGSATTTSPPSSPPMIDDEPAVNICNRTKEVHTAIRNAIDPRSPPNCDVVTQTQLNEVTALLFNKSLSQSTTLSFVADDFANLPNLRILGLHDSNLTELPENAFDNLSSLKALLLHSSNLSELPENVFDNLSSLQTLLLYSSNLTDLPENVFDGLSTNLQTLGLHSNVLSELPENVFGSLFNLENLWLQHSDLTSLPTDVFDELSNLQTLFLHSSNLVELPENVFDDLSSLQTLLLHSNALTELPENVFDNLSSLQTLFLYNSNLTELPASVFDDLPDLQTLSLYDNNLNSLPENVFDRLSNLENLWLQHSNLTSLPENVFDRLSSLQTLILSRNALTSLPESVFDELSNLQTLNLYDNALASLPENVFDNLTSLKTLSLYDNALTSLPENVFDNLTSLKTLSLYDNALTSLPENVFDNLASLKTLSLYDNYLTSLPAGVFDNLSSLKTLSLHNNYLISLPASVFDGLSNLQTLSLYDNHLASLPENVFDNLASLKTLWLQRSNLTSLSADVFNRLFSLQTLSLSHNALTSLPESVFDELSSLQTLFLHSNNLISLPAGVFDDLSSLQTLFLYSNNLTSLPENVFDNLTNLQTLWLQRNNLISLSADVFDNLSSLQTLLLYRNNLVSLPENVFDELPDLRTLLLHSNNLASLPAGIFNDVLDKLTFLLLDDDLRGNVSIDPLTANLIPGTIQTLTAQLTQALPATVRLTITAGGTQANAITLPNPATVTIPAGMTSTAFDITLSARTTTSGTGTIALSDPALLYTDALGNTRINTTASTVFSLVNRLDAAVNTFIFLTDLQSSETVNICSRTPEVETAIILQITETNCAIVPQTQLNTVTMLDLSGTETEFDSNINTPVLNSIPPLKTGDFANLPNLQTLNLFGNDLTSLPENIFDGLSNLQTLNLENNDLTSSLHENVFDGLSNLRELNLEDNDLTSPLHENIFNGLSNLQDLDLENNDLTLLPENIFRGLSNLQELDMENNDLASLPENIFDGLSNLQTLNLEDNNLASPLHENVFDELSNLRELNLEDNDLTSPLHENIFNGLSNLQDLDLENNDLTLLPENIFRGLSNLQELDLDDNDLTLLPENIFDGLSNLQRLNLENNDLASPLHENVFDGLSNLQNLDLENNDLTLLPENIFDGLSSLQELDLRNNNLISLPIGIFNDTLGTLIGLRLDDTLKDSISIEPRTASIMPGTIQTLTAQLTGTLPSTMRLTVTKTDNITAPATVTIPAGMTSATFDIALATEIAISNAGTVTLSAPVLLYTDALGNTRANTEPGVVFSLVNPLDAATNTFTFIAPDTTADYDSTADITITEGGGAAASAERTLIFGRALNAQAIVSFELTGGTLGVQGVTTNPDLTFTVGDSETEPTVDANGMTNGRFNIPAGTTSVILTFKAITDTDGDDETITFRITGIEFSDSGTATDIPTAALPSRLTIRITDAGADAVVIVDGGDTSISELLPGSTGESAVIRVKLTNIPSTVTSAVIGFTLGGTATRETDYTVTLAGSSTAADSVTITDADIAGTAPGVPQGGARGSAEATLTFHALNDSADIENESIVLTINSVTFEGSPASNLMSADIAGSSQTITITDRPTSPRAVISVGEAKITEGDGLSENPNFRITFINIDSSTPGATSMVNYTFDNGFSAAASPNPLECADGAGKYCAFSSISNSLAGLTNSAGSFSFTVSSINGVNAEISIFILPREDPDAEDETVELTVNSITVPQSGGTLTFNIANGNLVNSDNTPTDKVRITIADDALRLRIRVFLEGVMQ